MRTPVLLIATLGIMLLAGAAVGATQAAEGGERVDVTAELEDRMFYENGSVNTSASAEEPDRFQEAANNTITPDYPESPAADAWLREHMIAPVLRASIWVAGFGAELGYAMASTIGASATRLVINGGLLAILVGVGWHAYRMVRELSA